jgi:hypothetical protein
MASIQIIFYLEFDKNTEAETVIYWPNIVTTNKRYNNNQIWLPINTGLAPFIFKPACIVLSYVALCEYLCLEIENEVL